jgi:hypothetical protein
VNGEEIADSPQIFNCEYWSSFYVNVLLRLFNSAYTSPPLAVGDVWGYIEDPDTSDTFEFNLPLQGSNIDISGNGNHIYLDDGAGDFFHTQDSTHHNIFSGFRIYEKAGEDDLYVPLYDVNGDEISITPGTDIPSGYSLASTHPAGTWHNGAETELMIAAGSYDGTGYPFLLSSATDPEEILHNSATGYCKAISYNDINTAGGIFTGHYFVCDVSTTNKFRNLLFYDGRIEPVFINSVDLHRFLNKTNFVVDSNNVYTYDANNHITTT